MPSQQKRFKTAVAEQSYKERQLSSLFSIVSNNLLVATEVLSSDYKIEAARKLELLSKKAKVLSKELVSNPDKEEVTKRISDLKHKMLELIVDLTEELSKLDASKGTNGKTISDIVLARRLLRESQRGLITIQD